MKAHFHTFSMFLLLTLPICRASLTVLPDSSCEDQVGATADHCAELDSDQSSCSFERGCFFDDRASKCRQAPRGYFSDGEGSIKPCIEIIGAFSIGVGWQSADCPTRCQIFDHLLDRQGTSCVQVADGMYVPACGTSAAACSVPENHEALSTGNGEDNCLSRSILSNPELTRRTAPVLVSYEPSIPGSSDICGILGEIIVRLTVVSGRAQVSARTGRRVAAVNAGQPFSSANGLFLILIETAGDFYEIQRDGKNILSIRNETPGWRGTDSLAMFHAKNAGNFFTGQITHSQWRENSPKIQAFPIRRVEMLEILTLRLSTLVRGDCEPGVSDLVKIAPGFCLRSEAVPAESAAAQPAPVPAQPAQTAQTARPAAVPETPGWAICLLVLFSLIFGLALSYGVFLAGQRFWLRRRLVYLRSLNPPLPPQPSPKIEEFSFVSSSPALSVESDD